MLPGFLSGIFDRGNAKLYGITTVSLALIVFVLDRLTKYAVMRSVSEGQSIVLVPGVFHITLVLNRGAAFGLFKGANIFFIALALFVAVFILYCVIRHKVVDIALSLPLGLIMGGACGNLTDRLMKGYVIDFIDLRVWPVFNLADSAISAGTAFLVWYIFTQQKMDTAE